MLIMLTMAFSLFPSTPNAQATSNTLQSLIERAKPGTTLVVPGGTYREAITVNKPLTLSGNRQVRIMNPKPDQPAIQIRSNDVTVTGFIIETRATAIFVEDSQRVTLDRNMIRNAKRSATQGRSTPGSANRSFAQLGGHGIHLSASNQVTITNHDIQGMHDGLYLDSSNRLIIRHNLLQHLRYGIHCMYTSETEITDNRGAYNVTGMMIMGVSKAQIRRNIFTKQSENVHAQGMLLYEVSDSVVDSNRLDGNRLGMLIEDSHRNVITDNLLDRNFIGIQLTKASANQLKGNILLANVIQIQANNNRQNLIRGNYWDDFQGIDANGDGQSDISYRMNPFFRQLAEQTPSFQLFFQSPGIVLTESLNRSGSERWTADEQPLMDVPAHVQRDLSVEPLKGASTFGFSIALLLFSIITTYLWGFRK